MLERWTAKWLEASMDRQVLMRLINERMIKLNPHAPLAMRLRKIADKLAKEKDLTR